MKILSTESEKELRGVIADILKDTVEVIKYNASKRYLKKVEAEDYCNARGTTFNKLLVAGLPVISIDGYIRYDRQDIDKFLQKYKSGS